MNAPTVDYGDADVAVRDDLVDAHRELLEHLASPGTWWTGAERLALAEEARRAPDCPLCAERKAALSPFAVDGEHAATETLPAAAVEAAHRIRTDSGRLSRTWFDGVAGELGAERYVELVGVVTLVAGLDHFARALGTPAQELPAPRAGSPSEHRPAGLTEGEAWVPMLPPEGGPGVDADVFGGARQAPNILRALSLVPDQPRMLYRVMQSHYFGEKGLTDPTARRALDRLQIELVAARVSALNECFY